MAVTYSTATTLAAWTKPGYAPNKLYNVIPYRANSEISADTVSDIPSLETAQDVFQQMINSGKYDQIKMTERLIVVPS